MATPAFSPGIFQLGLPYILYTKAIPVVSSLEAILIDFRTTLESGVGRNLQAKSGVGL